MHQITNLKELLQLNISASRQKIDIRFIDNIEKDFLKWLKISGKKHLKKNLLNLSSEVIDFLIIQLGELRKEIETLNDRQNKFSQRISVALTEDERNEHILRSAKFLGAGYFGLIADKHAFSRWFGIDAIMERYKITILTKERKITFIFNRIGAISAFLIKKQTSFGTHKQTWKRLKLESAVWPFLQYKGDQRVSIEAFRCLSTALKAMPVAEQEGSIDSKTIQYVYRASLDKRQYLWIQCEALTLLESSSLESFKKALEYRLTNPQEGDDLFFRQRAVILMGNTIERLPELAELIPVIANDPSEYVRKTLPQILHKVPAQTTIKWLNHLYTNDSVPQVRAAVLLEIKNLLQSKEALLTELLSIFSYVFNKEKDKFVMRIALKCAVDTMSVIRANKNLQWSEIWYKTILARIEEVHTTANDIALRRLAANARERLWSEYDYEAQQIRLILTQNLQDLKPGKWKRLPGKLFKTYREGNIFRTLSVMAQEDFGFFIDRSIFGCYIRKDYVFGFRLWRFWLELRTPSPDKRQAFKHTVGRIFKSNIHIPSSIMAELTETKVPGEPLFISEEAGWRPFLPLMDQVLSSLQQGLSAKPVYIYTSEGITELSSPGMLQTLIAKIKITFNFSKLAKLRNLRQSGNQYVHALSKLGFKINIRPYQSKEYTFSLDPAVVNTFVINSNKND